VEQGLRALAGTKLEEHEKLSTILLITSFTRSCAQLSGEINRVQDVDRNAAEIMNNYGALVLRLTSRDEFPALRAVVEDDVFEESPQDELLEHDYRFTLERVLDGIEALVRMREMPC
jgi:tetracycline repressor-like protein